MHVLIYKSDLTFQPIHHFLAKMTEEHVEFDLRFRLPSTYMIVGPSQ